MKAHAVAAMTTALHDLGAGLLRHQPIHSSHSTLHPRCNLMRTGGRRYQLAAGHHLLPHRLARETPQVPSQRRNHGNVSRTYIRLNYFLFGPASMPPPRRATGRENFPAVSRKRREHRRGIPVGACRRVLYGRSLTGPRSVIFFRFWVIKRVFFPKADRSYGFR